MNRYEPRSYQTLSGDFVAVMDRDDNGTYITYSSHRQEIESLQARLKALESKQKDSISISSIISEHVEDALRKSIGETVHEVLGDMLKAGLNKYNGDPCHGTVDSILDDLAVDPGKTVKADTYAVADELAKNSKFTFGTNFGEGRAVFHKALADNLETRFGGHHLDAVESTPRERKVAVCYYVAGNVFIKGGEYEYEVDECEPGCEPRVIYIAQDAFVSNLKGDYRWDAVRFGSVNVYGCDLDSYTITNPDGVVIALFYIK